MMVPGVDSVRSLYAPRVESLRMLKQSDAKSARKQRDEEERHKRNMEALEARGRSLADVASKGDPMLLDLWEIMFEVHQSYDEKKLPNKIRSYLNLDRFYILRRNPLNESLCDEWFIEEELPSDIKKNLEKNKIFKL